MRDHTESVAEWNVPPPVSVITCVVAPRDRILNYIFIRFYTDTINAVGVDTISRDAGVAKSQLYHCFKSKNGLVLAYLECRYKSLWTWFTGSIEARSADPVERLMAAFDVCLEECQADELLGCAIVNALAEVGRRIPGVRDVALRWKTELGAYFAELARQAGFAKPEELGAMWMLLLDGAIVGAQRGQLDAVGVAKECARSLLPHLRGD